MAFTSYTIHQTLVARVILEVVEFVTDLTLVDSAEALRVFRTCDTKLEREFLITTAHAVQDLNDYIIETGALPEWKTTTQPLGMSATGLC